MGDNGFHTKKNHPKSSTNAPNKKNPRKFYNHFLFKAFIVTIFLVIIPLFPLQPPNFINPTIFTTSWEIIHLIFVGIAVSYGLFSRKNDDDDDDDEKEGENNGNLDNTQSYLSKLLHVSSVFDDEIDGCSNGSCDNDDNVKKVETWSSKYIRNEPMLVVAEKNSKINGEKPLLLPVRSLKSRVCDDKNGEILSDFEVSRVYTRSNTSPIVKGFSSNSISLSKDDDFNGRSNPNASAKEFSSECVNSRVGGNNDDYVFVDRNSEDYRLFHRSNSSVNSRGFSNHSRRHSSGDYRELDDGGVKEGKEKVEEQSVVLPSPIPWRSRSGRMEMKEGLDNSTANLLPPSLEESEAARLLKSRLSSSTKELSPPRKQSSSQSLSLLELEAKSVQDFGKRKSNFSSRLPPPPPPPPPPRFQSASRSQLVNKSQASRGVVTDESSVGKSVRTHRPKEVESAETQNTETKSKATDFFEHVLMESDDESESEGENDREEKVEARNVDKGTSEIVNLEGRDVDKDADEFIAKFREQIRLQRIESIKKSTGQLKRSSAR